MGAVKAWIMDIEEEIIDVVANGKILTYEVKMKIADKCGATLQVVEEVYADIQKEYYDW